MRPVRNTEAHRTEDLGELVCTNSFKSEGPENAHGQLKREMRALGSVLLRSADQSRVAAGSALAVDRSLFSQAMTAAVEAEARIRIVREECVGLPEGPAIIATGPLTSPSLAAAIQSLTGEDALAFFDAIAPIIHRESIDMDTAWFQSRYDKGSGSDYINCPMNEAQYDAFLDALADGDKTIFKEWEENTPYFEGCLPIEVMASRGRLTLAYGPMKPVGLTNPHNPMEKAYAIVQLRQDNALGTLFNMVGFQTKLKYGEQSRIFRMIPGLEGAEFARLGGLHRNTFLNAPSLLDDRLRLRVQPRLRFAGQITGCEGYVESAAIGLLAGRFAAAECAGISLAAPPVTTALGAILAHITGGAEAETYQPMNVNFGLFPPLAEHHRKKARKQAYGQRALGDLGTWLSAQ